MGQSIALNNACHLTLLANCTSTNKTTKTLFYTRGFVKSIKSAVLMETIMSMLQYDTISLTALQGELITPFGINLLGTRGVAISYWKKSFACCIAFRQATRQLSSSNDEPIRRWGSKHVK